MFCPGVQSGASCLHPPSSAPWGTPGFAVWDLQAQGSCSQGHTGVCSVPCGLGTQLWGPREGLQDTCKSWGRLQAWETDGGEVRAG